MSQLNSLTPFTFSCVLAFSILLFATTVTKIALFVKPENETFKKVLVIVKSWWLIVGVLLISLSWKKWGLILTSMIVSIFMISEYLKVSKLPYKKYAKGSFILLIILQHVALGFESIYFFLSLIPLLCLFIVPALVIFRATISNLELVFSVLFGMAFTVYYISYLAGLVALHSALGITADQATMAVVILVLITWGNDVFQFISGKSFGKTKVVPNVSPNKTLAGFIGGIICSTGVAMLVGPVLLNLTLLSCLILGPLLSLTGMFGDLFFSAVKRNIGTKDFSNVLPGHGGILDRIDSLIFTTPIFFNFLFIFNGGKL